jgi:hypothetical protein
MINCSICEKEIEDKVSNNAEPINDGRCCNECNIEVVVPTRLNLTH